MNIMVFDTETTNLEKPFCYNIGYVVYNTDTAEIICKKEFVIEQVWHNPMLFVTAYYAEKKELYISRLKGRKCTLEKFGYATQTMYRDIKQYEIHHAFAYNSDFDVRVFEYNCDWFKCINPLDTVQVHDIRGQVHEKIAFDKIYQAYCETYELFTESGNYSTTAESVYKFIKQNDDFVEEHTALADSLIELEILLYCINKGCEYENDYKTYTTIPRTILKKFEVIDANGTSHKFDYTDKRKIRGEDGIRLIIKQNEGS